MKTHYQQVKEFMRLMEQECPESPTIPSLAIRKLRAKTILEEALERIHALGFAAIAPDSCGEDVEILIEDVGFEGLYDFSAKDFLDGVCDGEYFDLGSLIALGISEEKYMEHFEKVHQANMGKLWSTLEVEDVEDELHEIGYIVKDILDKGYYNIDRKYDEPKYLVKDKNGKVIKPPSFKAPETEI